MLGFLGTASVEAQSTTIVISEVQVAGDTPDAAAGDEFIELYNKSASDFDLNGHRLVYRTYNGINDTTFKSWSSSTIIPPGKHYLIAASGGYYNGSIPADATFAGSAVGKLRNAGGGVAIRQGAEDTGTIIDSVGYGDATNAFVETAAAPAPPANQSIERLPLGVNSQDTDNNANDFSTQTSPNPQNLTWELNVSGSDVSANMSPGTTNNEMLSIQLNTAAGTLTVDSITFDFSGTADSGDFPSSGIKLWNDAGTVGTYDEGVDSQLGASQNFASSVTFSSLNYSVSTTPTKNLLLTVDIASGANQSHTLGAKLNDNTKITLTGGGTVGSFSAISTVSDKSLPVTLSSFTAISTDSVVMLKWRTESEVDNMGWNIYRCETKDGKFVKINDKLIPGVGNSAMPNSYQFVDKTVVKGRQYYYYLEDVDITGMRNKSSVISSKDAKKLTTTWSKIKKG
jgi:hypothetical protein